MMKDHFPFLIMNISNIILLCYDTPVDKHFFDLALRSEREGFMLHSNVVLTTISAENEQNNFLGIFSNVQCFDPSKLH